MDLTAELRHHGVKGMKWGIRRREPKKVSGSKAAKKKRRDLGKNVGAGVGAATGAAVALVALKGARTLLRSRAFNKFFVDKALAKLNAETALPDVVKMIIGSEITYNLIKSNYAQAALLDTPQAKILVAKGGALMGTAIGSIAGARIQVAREGSREYYDNYAGK